MDRMSASEFTRWRAYYEIKHEREQAALEAAQQKARQQ